VKGYGAAFFMHIRLAPAACEVHIDEKEALETGPVRTHFKRQRGDDLLPTWGWPSCQ